MALTKVSGGILDPGINVAGIVTATGFDGPFTGGSSKNIIAGIITATGLDLNGNGDISGDLVIHGNLTANGDFTTLNTTLREVEILRVDANTTAVAGIITQRGSGDIFSAYDASTQVFKIADGGDVTFFGATTDRDIIFDRSENTLQVKHNAILKIGQGSYSTDLYSDGTNTIFDHNTIGALFIKSNIFQVYGTGTSGGNTYDGTIFRCMNGRTELGYEVPNGGATTLDNLVTTPLGVTVGTGVTIERNGQASFAGIVTFTGNIDANGNLDVDGQTDLDALNVTDTAVFSGHLRSTGTDGVSIDTAGYAYLNFQTDRTNASDNIGGPIFKNASGTAVSRIQSFVDGQINIRTGSGNSPDYAFVAKPDGAVELYHNGTKKFETTANGAAVSNIQNNEGLNLNGVGNNTCIKFLSTGSSPGHSYRVNFHSTTGGIFNSPCLAFDKIATNGNFDSHIAAISDTGFHLDDNKKLHLGGKNAGAGDLQIYHDTNNSFIENSTGQLSLNNSGGNIAIRASDSNADFILRVGGSSASENAIVAVHHGEVVLSCNGATKLTTTNTGITVTGEVAATQDYPNVRPLLDFNFSATKKLDPRLEYRRTGPASFVNEFGNIVLVGDDTPRFDHDPVTRESKGILIEGQRTNNVANSQNVGGYSGGYMNGGTFTYPDDVTAPDGSTKGVVKMISDTSTGYHGVQYTISGFGSNQNWAYQVWVKALPGSSINEITLYDNAQSGATNNGSIRVNLATGAIPYNGNSGEIVAYNNGWYQIKIKGNRVTTNAQSSMLLVLYNGSTNSYAGDGSSGFYIWGGQYENDTHHWTSYIPTYGTIATRGRDELTMSGSDLTDVFNNEEGTMFYEASLGDLTIANQPIVAFRDLGTVTANYHAMGWRIGGGTDVIRTWFKSASNNEHLSAHASTGLTANMFYKHIYGYKDADCADAYRTPTNSGILSNQVGNGSPMIAAGVVDELRFGGYYAYESQPTTYDLNAGHIKRFSYWPQKLTNTQLTTYIS